jgi:hypothetical protein
MLDRCLEIYERTIQHRLKEKVVELPIGRTEWCPWLG